MEPRMRCGTHWIGHNDPPKGGEWSKSADAGQVLALQSNSKGNLVFKKNSQKFNKDGNQKYYWYILHTTIFKFSIPTQKS